MEKNYFERCYEKNRDEENGIFDFCGYEISSGEELEDAVVFLLTDGWEDLDVDVYEAIKYLGNKWKGRE